MRKSLWWFLVAFVLLAVVGAGTAVAQVASAQVRSTPVPAVKALTVETLRAEPVDLSRLPRLLAKLAVPNTPPDWNGPDLPPTPPLLPGKETMVPALTMFLPPAAGCNTSQPHPRVTAKVDPSGEGPATGNNTQVYDICM